MKPSLRPACGLHSSGSDGTLISVHLVASVLVPFVRGLIKGVYGSSEGDVMPSEESQGGMEEVNV